MAKDKSTIGADLEATSNTQKISKHAKVEIPDFTNREFLENKLKDLEKEYCSL